LDYQQRLINWQLPVTVIHHAPVWHLTDLAQQTALAGRAIPKNLLLTDKRTGECWLYIQLGPARLDFKALATQLGISRSRLAFATDEVVQQVLQTVPGMVTPLTLMPNSPVTIILQHDLLKAPELGFHLADNTQTALLQSTDLLRFFKHLGLTYQIF
jgi:Ala-tRNA(Pro) deacylase